MNENERGSKHRDVDAALRTGQLGRVQVLLAAHHGDLHQSVRQLHCQLDRLRQTVLDSRLHQQSVNHQFDGVVLALVQLDLVVGNVAQLIVNAGSGEALLRQLVQFLLKLSLAPANDGRHDHHPVLGLQVHYPLHNLVGRLARDGASALRTMRHANGGIQQAQVVVDLGDGAYGRTRAAAGGLLLDGDGRTQPINAIDIGPLHLVEKLTRIRR